MLGRLRHDEGGFGLVESVMALGVIFTSLLALVYTATVGLSDIAFSRQRQQATGIANQLLEEVRSLPIGVVKRGLSDSDLSGDPNIVLCSGEYYFEACPTADPNAEKIAHTPGLSPTSPLVPHTGIIGPPDFTSSYSWSVYVTEAADADVHRVTAIVSWANAQRSGVNDFIQAQTVMFGRGSCVDEATSGFAGPCQPFFYGTGTFETGTATITGTVSGLSFDSMVIELGSLSASVQQEQTAAVQGTVTLPVLKRTVAGVTTPDEADSTLSAADNDPTTTTPDWERTGVSSPGSINSQISGGGNHLRLSSGSGKHDGETTSTTSAGGAKPCNGQADGRPCGHGELERGGTIEADLRIGGGVGDARLIQVAPQTDPDTAYARRIVSTGNGTVKVTMERNIPDIRMGGLFPDMSGPNGWPGYWVRLADYVALAEAEAGLNAAAPTVNADGDITAWKAAGPETTPVTAQGGTVPINSLNHQQNLKNGKKIRVLISGTVSVGQSSTSLTLDPGNSSVTTDAGAVAGPPLVVDISYRVEENNVLIADLRIVLALGSVATQAAHQLGTGS